MSATVLDRESGISRVRVGPARVFRSGAGLAVLGNGAASAGAIKANPDSAA
ncbi:MAG: hypothetical protein WB710_01940 [Stellaceae bacterium]